MVDFNGSGGLAGTSPFANFVGGGPAMSAGQINASMGYNPNANPYDPFAQSGGFGAQTDYYSGLGAAYGRNVGPQMTDNIYGVSGDTWSRMSPSDRSQFNAQMGGSGAQSGGGGGGGFGSGAQPFNDYGGGANPGGFSPSPNYPGGTQGQSPMAGYNAGGFNPYSSQTFAPSAQGNVGTGTGGNAYGVDAGTWGRMSAADQGTFNRQMASSGASPIAGYNSGGFDPYSAQTFAPSAQGNVGGGGGRDQLANLLMQGAGSQGGTTQPTTLYSGNLFGANNGAGIAYGTQMGPGYGGFDNSAGGPAYNNPFVNLPGS